MCGRLNVTDDQFVVGLVKQLGINLNITPIKPKRFIQAASPVQIIYEREGQRCMKEATWWLLLEPTETGFKPSKYTSFNTRYDKLNVPRSAGYQPFRESRCIIVAKGFGETEFTYLNNKKIPKHYYDMSAINGAIAFGGLFKEYQCKATGKVITGCSIITLPPHEKLKHIHTKASPLMLPQDTETLNAWLDSSNQEVNMFNHLLKPTLRQNLFATKIDRPSTYQPLAEPLLLEADH